jgi:hypothetical protein
MKTAERSEWPLSSIPNFFVIGVVKGGTTSLYHYLDQHNDIYLPSVKETNHFAQNDVNEKNFLPGYALDVKIDFPSYISSGMIERIHIAHVNDPVHYKALFSKVDGQKAIGEISNSYMICPSAATAIHQFNPDAKIIVMLRNPVSRAWSQYLMNLREAKTSELDFLTELQVDAARVNKGWGVNHQYLELGNYATQLKPYFELFGKGQVLPLFYEEYRDNPREVLKEICQFLNVNTDVNFDFSIEANKASLPRSKALNKILVGSGFIKQMKDIIPKRYRTKLADILYTSKGLPSIQQHEVDFLVDYYKDEVERLESMLKINLKLLWKEFN